MLCAHVLAAFQDRIHPLLDGQEWDDPAASAKLACLFDLLQVVCDCRIYFDESLVSSEVWRSDLSKPCFPTIFPYRRTERLPWKGLKVVLCHCRILRSDAARWQVLHVCPAPQRGDRRCGASVRRRPTILSCQGIGVLACQMHPPKQ